MNFKCKPCNRTMQLEKATMAIVNSKVVFKEAVCKCGEYMEGIREEAGFGVAVMGSGGVVKGKLKT